MSVETCSIKRELRVEDEVLSHQVKKTKLKENSKNEK